MGEILKLPIEKTNLPKTSINFFQKIGAITISSLLPYSESTEEEITKRIIYIAAYTCGEDKIVIEEAKKASIVLINFLKENGIKIKPPVQHNELGIAEDLQKLRNVIAMKIAVAINSTEMKYHDSIFQYADEIIEETLYPTIQGLDVIETSVLRAILGVYTKGIEQTTEQAKQILREKRYEIKNIGITLYEVLDKIVNQIKTEQETIEK